MNTTDKIIKEFRRRFTFAIQVNDNQLIGVAIAGRPVARLLDDGKTLEILRNF